MAAPLHEEPQSVCIIGAGPSGLVAAKTFLYDAPADAFIVTVLDKQAAAGGLWPTSPADCNRRIHPLMVTNLSRHTMNFAHLAWDDDVPHMPRAWHVGRYLQRYLNRYLTGRPGFALRLRTRVVGVRPDPAGGWLVTTKSGGHAEETARFDRVVVASGHYGEPLVPGPLSAPSSTVPVVHSSQYRNLEGLLGASPPQQGSILVVGGQMSGVELASTIAVHLSSAAHAPGAPGLAGAGGLCVHHLVQRPIWVLPTFTTPQPEATAPPFRPVDVVAFDLNRRPRPPVNSENYADADAARAGHAIFQSIVGHDQAAVSPQLRIGPEAVGQPPYMAVSDWYCELVRAGAIAISTGRLEALQGSVAKLSPGQAELHDVAAVVLATGFDASAGLGFICRSVLARLQHEPQHPEQPLALAFHGTHHPDVPGLGFVGLSRSPFWGLLQMQARLLTRLWRRGGPPEALRRKLAADDSLQRVLAMRKCRRVPQFPAGDYLWLMHEFAEALGMQRSPAPACAPLDVALPCRYALASDDAREVARSAQQALGVVALGLDQPVFVARAVFRSLLGSWSVERDVNGAGPRTGTASFLLRRGTLDGLGSPSSASFDDAVALEYLHVDDLPTADRQVWRYDERRDVLGVWLVKPDDGTRADSLMHELVFERRRSDEPWTATADGSCAKAPGDVRYAFYFRAVTLDKWTLSYTLDGRSVSEVSARLASPSA